MEMEVFYETSGGIFKKKTAKYLHFGLDFFKNANGVDLFSFFDLVGFEEQKGGRKIPIYEQYAVVREDAMKKMFVVYEKVEGKIQETKFGSLREAFLYLWRKHIRMESDDNSGYYLNEATMGLIETSVRGYLFNMFVGYREMAESFWEYFRERYNIKDEDLLIVVQGALVPDILAVFRRGDRWQFIQVGVMGQSYLHYVISLDNEKELNNILEALYGLVFNELNPPDSEINKLGNMMNPHSSLLYRNPIYYPRFIDDFTKRKFLEFGEKYRNEFLNAKRLKIPYGIIYFYIHYFFSNNVNDLNSSVIRENVSMMIGKKIGSWEWSKIIRKIRKLEKKDEKLVKVGGVSRVGNEYFDWKMNGEIKVKKGLFGKNKEVMLDEFGID